MGEPLFRFLTYGFFLALLAVPTYAQRVNYGLYAELVEELFLAALAADTSQAGEQNAQFQRLEIRFLKPKLSGGRFSRIIVRNASINTQAAFFSQHALALDEFFTLFEKGFRRGDQLVLARANAGGLEVSFNGVALGNYENELFPIILNAWIGDIPPSREFKEALLGQIDGARWQAAFQALQPSPQRMEEVQIWWAEHSPQARAAKQQQEAAAKAAALKRQEAQRKTQAELARKRAREQEQQEQQLAMAQAVQEEAERLRLAEMRALQFDYAKQLVQHARTHIVYSRRSQQLRHTGSILALVSINRQGSLVGLHLQEKARFASLNKAVERGVKKSLPFPSVPESIPGDVFTFQLPVDFQLKGN